MIKKLLALFTAVIICGGALSACSDGDKKDSSVSDTSDAVTDVSSAAETSGMSCSLESLLSAVNALDGAVRFEILAG